MFIIGILFVIIIFGLFFLLRATGRFGQRPSPDERARHSTGEGRGPGPRATGMN
jgi:hypothetical protein